jgi:hypothetical protein
MCLPSPWTVVAGRPGMYEPAGEAAALVLACLWECERLIAHDEQLLVMSVATWSAAVRAVLDGGAEACLLTGGPGLPLVLWSRGTGFFVPRWGWRCCIGCDRIPSSQTWGYQNSPRPPPSHCTVCLGRFLLPPDLIVLAVRWYLLFSLSYRDVEELLAEAASRSTTSPSTGGCVASRACSPSCPALPTCRR